MYMMLPVSSIIFPVLYVPATPTIQNLPFWKLGQTLSVLCTLKVNFPVTKTAINTLIDISLYTSYICSQLSVYFTVILAIGSSWI